MYEIAKLPSEEREILFQNAAARKGMNAAIIEKDFCVCLTLDYLLLVGRSTKLMRTLDA